MNNLLLSQLPNTLTVNPHGIVVTDKNVIPQENKIAHPEILFITSFPPRECGIATYSQDLMEAMSNKFNNSISIKVCALEAGSEQYNYKTTPKYILDTSCENSYAETAFRINRDSAVEMVVIQHEFGFFAKNEDHFQQFIEALTKPVIIVFHTVLPKPGRQLMLKVQAITNVAASIIVMTNSSADILLRDYETPIEKLNVIPHGTHLVPRLDKTLLKIKYNVTDRKVLSTFGLLSSGKSIETTLDALTGIVKQHPEVIFLIIGKTHP
jgi:glycosyltransferase involved in cell wall biosynthesis